jgi:hypothetical protein
MVIGGVGSVEEGRSVVPGYAYTPISHPSEQARRGPPGLRQSGSACGAVFYGTAEAVPFRGGGSAWRLRRCGLLIPHLRSEMWGTRRLNCA